MVNPDEYSRIKDAVDQVQSKENYGGHRDILSETPSEGTITQWTDALTGFEAGATVSGETKSHFDAIESLYRQSEPTLERHASEIGVLSLNEFSPKHVLFMVCVRELQNQYAGKTNLNPHKFSVLRGGRYSID